MANARALDICLEGGKVSLEDLRHHTRPNPCMLILKGARACWDVRRSLPAKGTATQCPEGFQMPGEWSSRAWARNEQKEHEAMVPRWCICLRYVPLARAPSVGSTAGLPQENCHQRPTILASSHRRLQSSGVWGYRPFEVASEVRSTLFHESCSTHTDKLRSAAGLLRSRMYRERASILRRLRAMWRGGRGFAVPL